MKKTKTNQKKVKSPDKNLRNNELVSIIFILIIFVLLGSNIVTYNFSYRSGANRVITQQNFKHMCEFVENKDKSVYYTFFSSYKNTCVISFGGGKEITLNFNELKVYVHFLKGRKKYGCD